MKKVEQNKMLKKEALLESAYELFTTLGFHKTSISDIASGAGVAKGTFYPVSYTHLFTRLQYTMSKTSLLIPPP